MRPCLLLGLAYVLFACAAVPTVPAALETQPVAEGEDAADDPAIWVNPGDPGASVVLGTSKRGGLYVYDLTGAVRQYLPVGNLNNVDLRAQAWGDPSRVLIAASARRPASLGLLELDPNTGDVRLARKHGLDLHEPYGSCMYQAPDGGLYVIVNDKDGRFEQYVLHADHRLELARVWRLDSQPEGCVADDARQVLYLGEEKRGIWQMSADPLQAMERRLVDEVGERLVADVEGLTIIGDALVASSQGNSSYAVYDLPSAEFVGSFRVGTGGEADAVSGTDGIAGVDDVLPGFEQGLLVVQDDVNTNPPANQNFKYVSWRSVLMALSITTPR